jgi:hypothetical protein
MSAFCRLQAHRDHDPHLADCKIRSDKNHSPIPRRCRPFETRRMGSCHLDTHLRVRYQHTQCGFVCRLLRNSMQPSLGWGGRFPMGTFCRSYHEPPSPTVLLSAESILANDNNDSPDSTTRSSLAASGHWYSWASCSILSCVVGSPPMILL